MQRPARRIAVPSSMLVPPVTNLLCELNSAIVNRCWLVGRHWLEKSGKAPLETREKLRTVISEKN